jgi:ABC-2 type transport system permease protein
MHNASGLAGVPVIVFLYVSLQLTFIAVSMMMIRMIPEQFIGMLQLLILPPVFLSSALFPMSFAPQLIRTVARFNPLTHAVEAMRVVLIDGLKWEAILLHWGIVIGTSAAALVLAHWIFTRGISRHDS